MQAGKFFRLFLSYKRSIRKIKTSFNHQTKISKIYTDCLVSFP